MSDIETPEENSAVETPKYGAAIEVAHFSGRTSLVYSFGERTHLNDLRFGKMKSHYGTVDNDGLTNRWRYPGENEWRR